MYSPNPSDSLSARTDDTSTRPSPAFSTFTDDAATFLTTPSRASSYCAPPVLSRAQSITPTLNECGSIMPAGAPSRLPDSPLLAAGDTMATLKWTNSANAVETLRSARAAECGDDENSVRVLAAMNVKDVKVDELSPPRREVHDYSGSPRSPGQEYGSPNLVSDSEEMSCGMVLDKAKETVQVTDAEGKGFDRFSLPTQEQLRAAKDCMLSNEFGATMTFESLVKERGQVVVVFLRHLWCGLCAQYVVALKSASENLAQASNSHLSADSSFYSAPPVYILLISSGSPSLIPIYQQRLGCPFPLVVDKGRKLYKALGMTLKSLSMGKEEEKGSYITKSKLENVIDSTKNGLAMRRYPGSQKQLGGEFVMKWNEDTEELKCTYASRMNTTRSHSEVRDLFAAAGVHLGAEDEASIFGESQHEP